MATTKKKHILLIFIHGFKGGDTTFSSFPTHITQLLSQHVTSSTTHEPLLYPAFETRGALPTAVTAFNDWLLNKVIDREIELGTEHPMVDPGVQVVLVGHSMGGIVAVEAVRALVRDLKPVGTGEEKRLKRRKLFPWVRGVLAFDTPYLGVEPGVVKYTAEDHWREGREWYDRANMLFGSTASTGSTSAGSNTGNAAAAKGLGGLFSKSSTAGSSGSAAKGSAAAAVGSAATATAATGVGAQGSSNKKGGGGGGGTPTWQKLAIGGAATAATAAIGTAAYLNRSEIQSSVSAGVATINSGFNSGAGWVTGHLEFVGCLARRDEMASRMAFANGAEKGGGMKAWGVGFANLYTVCRPGDGRVDRTFCFLPGRREDMRGLWFEALNSKAAGEVQAHVGMFLREENDGFDVMGEKARDLMLGWTEDEEGDEDQDEEEEEEEQEEVHLDRHEQRHSHETDEKHHDKDSVGDAQIPPASAAGQTRVLAGVDETNVWS